MPFGYANETNKAAIEEKQEAIRDVELRTEGDETHTFQPRVETLTTEQRLYALEQTAQKLLKRIEILEELLREELEKSMLKAQANAALSTTADEKKSYNAALKLLKETHYAKARDAFEQFLEAYPQSVYVPQALYWKGVSFFAEGDYEPALKAFQLFLRAWPQHAKALDAQLKIILCHQNRGEKARACIALEILKGNLNLQNTHSQHSVQTQKVAHQVHLLERALQCEESQANQG